MGETQARFIRSAVCATFFSAALLVGSVRAQETATDPAKVAAGEKLFNGTQMGACWACHGKGGKGTSTAPNLTDQTWLDADGTLESIKQTITTGVPKPKKHPGAMPPMGGAKLSPDEIDALAQYVYSLSHGAGAAKKK
jgi:cbb3-type cytochrome c oxidase subunit III